MIDSATEFSLLAFGTTLQAGTYRIHEHDSASDVIAILRAGPPPAPLLRLVIPEGFAIRDIARDGTQGGPNVTSTEAVARAAGIPLFASGGVGRLEDIRQLAAIPGVEGVIVGRALYTGAVSLRAALAEAR